MFVPGKWSLTPYHGAKQLPQPHPGRSYPLPPLVYGFGDGLCSFTWDFRLSRIAAFPMKGKHAFEKDQGAATVRAMRAEGRSGLRGRQLWNAVGLLQDQLTDAIGGETGVGAHEAEVPDLHESRGEDMLEEAA